MVPGEVTALDTTLLPSLICNITSQLKVVHNYKYISCSMHCHAALINPVPRFLVSSTSPPHNPGVFPQSSRYLDPVQIKATVPRRPLVQEPESSEGHVTDLQAVRNLGHQVDSSWSQDRIQNWKEFSARERVW